MLLHEAVELLAGGVIALGVESLHLARRRYIEGSRKAIARVDVQAYSGGLLQ